jgi:hypothetical protein
MYGAFGKSSNHANPPIIRNMFGSDLFLANHKRIELATNGSIAKNIFQYKYIKETESNISILPIFKTIAKARIRSIVLGIKNLFVFIITSLDV